ALVVFALGVVAILLSAELPGWVDTTMERVVGVTLLVLGTYVVVSLVRHGRDFRMRSRWMLVLAGARRGARWLRGRHAPESVELVHEHEHKTDGSHGHVHAPAHDLVPAGGAATASLVAAPSLAEGTHRHVHRHVGTMPDDPFPSYGRATAFGVGLLHGI